MLPKNLRTPSRVSRRGRASQRAGLRPDLIDRRSSSWAQHLQRASSVAAISSANSRTSAVSSSPTIYGVTISCKLGARGLGRRARLFVTGRGESCCTSGGCSAHGQLLAERRALRHRRLDPNAPAVLGSASRRPPVYASLAWGLTPAATSARAPQRDGPIRENHPR